MPIRLPARSWLVGGLMLAVMACAPAAAPAPTAAPAKPTDSKPAAPAAPAASLVGAPAAASPAAAAAKPAASPAASAALKPNPELPPQPIEFRMATTQPTDSTTDRGAQRFAELVAQRTNNRVTFKIFPNNQLGQPPVQAEGLRTGVIDSAWASSAAMGAYVPEVRVIDFPYLFRDREHVARVMESEVGKGFERAVESKGVKVLGWGEIGFRHITNNKRPIVQPADLQGLRIRVFTSDVYVETFKSFGANVVPLNLGEVYAALQTGAVDGQENPTFVIIPNKFHEVQSHLTLSGHIYSDWQIAMNLQKFNALPKDTQDILLVSAREAGQYQIQLNRDEEASNLKFLADRGIKIVDTIDYDTWRKAVQPVYDRFAEQYGKESIDKIQALAR